MEFEQVKYAEKIASLAQYMKAPDRVWSLQGLVRHMSNTFGVTFEDVLKDHNMLEAIVSFFRTWQDKLPENEGNFGVTGVETTRKIVGGTDRKENKTPIATAIPPIGESVEKSYSRKGQAKFRRGILKLYNNCCIISAAKGEHVLEAAHIHPYAARGGHALSNGLALRKDIHALFDRDLIGFEPDGTSLIVHIADSADKDVYGGFTRISLEGIKTKPNEEALAERFRRFKEANEWE